MQEFTDFVLRAAQDEDAMEQLIVQHEFFILKSAAAATHRFLTKQDDEWSVALLAFSTAVKAYSPEKGAFLPFAQLVIRRRLTDYLRSQSRFSPEISVSPIAFDEPPGEDSEQGAIQSAVIHQVAQVQEHSLQWEIAAVNQTFLLYGFTFFDLADCSPKAEKTKKACAQAIAVLVRKHEWMTKMQDSRTLPIKEILQCTDLPRKILERHRKYIIAAAEILSGEYPCLAEYMRFVREELAR